MKKLINFCKSLQTIDNSKRYELLREINASEDVINSVNETVDSLSKDGVKLIIEPVETSILHTFEGNQEIFKGNFTYVFEKDGIFHNIPGDTSTQAEKKPEYINEEIRFTVDPTTQEVTSVYESMAANTFGQKAKSRTTNPIVLFILFSIILFAVSIYIMTQ